MRPQEIITIKRDGGELSDVEIRSFIDGVCDGSWADYQISALIMAMVIRGLSPSEQDSITRAMLYSGDVIDLSEIAKPKGDKHSTGGVGDKTSLVIAPIAAACGVAVPMISGRGLGHTGGTLDKLEAIPGYNVMLTTAEFRRVIGECGFAMAGQTADIAPADRKIYALRDATATVPCIPLIVASIMSKKLAEGLDSLVLDVKTGSGAFMPEYADSVRLAEALVSTGKNFGVRTEAVISDMGQPLGEYVGNAVETYECIQILRGDTGSAASATVELSIELSARLLVLAGITSGMEDAVNMASSKLANGEAFEKFRQNVMLQGGDVSVCDAPESLLDPDVKEVAIRAVNSGHISEIDTYAVGNAIVDLGGGRRKAEDGVDHGVGLKCVAKVGDEVSEGDVLGIMYCREGRRSEQAAEAIRSAYRMTSERPETKPLIRTVVA